MGSFDAGITEARPRREEFPVDTYRHLEGMLQEIRRRIMDRAAQMAAEEQQAGDVYRVERRHVDRALIEVVSDTDTCIRSTGLEPPD
jgi:hypothetical protein